MRPLHVGKGVDWPAALASQATALLGVRGAGKSNLARVVAEECAASKIPFVVFDPIGNWYGLRAGSDGRPAGGVPVPIFGGEHGDLPLDRSSGAKVADLVVDRKLSCVLDLSHPDFSEADKRRFLTEFGDRLFRRKSRDTGWLLLILEEADDYAPQSPRGPQAECLGVFQRIVKRGRFKGLGALLITQRSASINKDLLNMIGTLVAFRTTAPHDRDAIERWLKHYAQSTDVAGTLPELRDGEAWVWSPEFLKELRRTRFRQMATFDTGSTPEHRQGTASAATLADIDLPALTKELQVAIEKAKADDPRELRKTIAELRAAYQPLAADLAPGGGPKEVHAALHRLRAQAAKPASAAPALKMAPPAVKAEHVKRLEAAATGLEKTVQQITVNLKTLLAGAAEAWALRADTALDVARTIRAAAAPPANPSREVGHVTGRTPAAAVRGNSDARVSRPQQEILDALAYFESVGVAAPSRRQAALVAKVSAVSSGYEKNVSTLRTLGLIAYPGPNLLQLTAEGRAAARAPEIPPTVDELQDAVCARLSKPQTAILRALIKRYPAGVSREDLAVASNQSDTSSGFEKNVSTLRTLGLINYPAPGEVAAMPVLFLEGA